MLCFIEPLGLPAGMLRPGGATANNADDQLAVIDQAIGWVRQDGQGADSQRLDRLAVATA